MCRRRPGAWERESERGEPALDGTFLAGVDASKRRWHEPSAQQKGILPAYRWTDPGRDGLEVAFGSAESRPNAATVREVWRKRHGHRAAPLLLVVDYPGGGRSRAVLCGPAGDDPAWWIWTASRPSGWQQPRWANRTATLRFASCPKRSKANPTSIPASETRDSWPPTSCIEAATRCRWVCRVTAGARHSVPRASGDVCTRRPVRV